jgi:hypothetical protein
MSERPHTLLVAPRPIYDESPASWIQRVCQMHSNSYARLLGHLGIPAVSDPDIHLPVDHLCHIGRGTYVPEEPLRSMGSIFHAVRTLPRLSRLLNYDRRGSPAYRVCVHCLATDAVPYLRIAWRFKDWRHCPIHFTQLIEDCSRCHASIVSTRPSLGQTPSGRRFNVSDCAGCHASLLEGGPGKADPSIDGRTLVAQTSVVSAVLHGFFCIEGFRGRLGLDFFLWLRDNYSWHGVRVVPGGLCSPEEGLAVSTIVRRLLKIYKDGSAATPPSLA